LTRPRCRRGGPPNALNAQKAQKAPGLARSGKEIAEARLRARNVSGGEPD
jgi:hypothetical protein